MFLDLTPTNSCLASCWLIVLDPPRVFKKTIALKVDLTSIPG